MLTVTSSEILANKPTVTVSDGSSLVNITAVASGSDMAGHSSSGSDSLVAIKATATSDDNDEWTPAPGPVQQAGTTIRLDIKPQVQGGRMVYELTAADLQNLLAGATFTLDASADSDTPVEVRLTAP